MSTDVFLILNILIIVGGLCATVIWTHFVQRKRERDAQPDNVAMRWLKEQLRESRNRTI